MRAVLMTGACIVAGVLGAAAQTPNEAEIGRTFDRYVAAYDKGGCQSPVGVLYRRRGQEFRR